MRVLNSLLNNHLLLLNYKFSKYYVHNYECTTNEIYNYMNTKSWKE